MKHADKVAAIEEFLDWREIHGESLDVRLDLTKWSKQLVTQHAIELLEEGLTRVHADLTREGAVGELSSAEDPIKDALELLRGSQ